MSFRKSETQNYFESMFPGNGGVPFKGLKKSIYETTILSEEQANCFASRLENEIASYYYKALLSCTESFSAIETHNYSWATVRLYYSVFYACKAYLACKNVAIVRAERRLYYFKASNGEKVNKCEDHTDHKGTMYVLEREYGIQDLLQSNSIDDKKVYDWMMEKREEVNYKDIEFHDPNPPEFWEKIEEEVKDKGLIRVIEMLATDNWIYCFQEEYGILGIPIKRLILTVTEIRKSGKMVSLTEDQKKFIEQYTYMLNEKTQKDLLLWK